MKAPQALTESYIDTAVHGWVVAALLRSHPEGRDLITDLRRRVEDMAANPDHPARQDVALYRKALDKLARAAGFEA